MVSLDDVVCGAVQQMFPNIMQLGWKAPWTTSSKEIQSHQKDDSVLAQTEHYTLHEGGRTERLKLFTGFG